MARRIWLALALAACDDKGVGVDSGIGGTSTGDEDADGDGFDWTEDCDDDDALVNPYATEVCDGVDNDCDGVTDEDDALDAPTWYADADQDGYGDPDDAVDACEQPSGAVDNALDCDDDDATVQPDADETCDGVDNDCDGSVDEDDATDPGTWWLDADGDGYGDPASFVEACTQPDGYADNDGDCDDGAAEASPEGVEACDGLDNDCDGVTDEDDALDVTTWFADADGDGFGDATSTVTACAAPEGYTADDSDCDDGSATVFPGADEYCDEVDTDCDGTLDEDPSGSDAGALDAATWYLDTDGDGYGSTAATTQACGQPTGYVDNDGDCDDRDAATSPAATELCDGDDNDCDGTTDEDDAEDASTWYADADGDSYGDPDSTKAACSRPAGYVSTALDCDDTDRAVNPAAGELCDGVDNDCDGNTDEDDASDATVWHSDGDGDGYGNPLSTTRSCYVPTGYVSDDSDCDDAGAAVYPGADEYCDGVDNDCNGVADEATALDAATWYRDVDGDGYGTGTSATKTACEQPTGYADNADDCDDGSAAVSPGASEVCSNAVDDDCDGNTDEDCPVEHCGRISSDETWEASVVHVVTCDVSVYGSSRPVLTVEDGAVVQFEAGTALVVGTSTYGGLDVQGTASGVTFTSAEPLPSPATGTGSTSATTTSAASWRGSPSSMVAATATATCTSTTRRPSSRTARCGTRPPTGSTATRGASRRSAAPPSPTTTREDSTSSAPRASRSRAVPPSRTTP